MLGFTKNEIIKITSLLPNIFVEEDNLLSNKFNYLFEFGYEEKDIINIIKKIPTILKNYYLEELESKLNKLLEIGFSKEDIIKMTIDIPYILLYSTDQLVNKVYGIKEFGYSLEQVIKMISNFPILFGYEINSIDKKIKFYKAIDLDEYIIENSHLLIYNLDYIKARWSIIDKKDKLDLFLTDKDFYKKYKVQSLDLIKE